MATLSPLAGNARPPSLLDLARHQHSIASDGQNIVYVQVPRSATLLSLTCILGLAEGASSLSQPAVR